MSEDNGQPTPTRTQGGIYAVPGQPLKFVEETDANREGEAISAVSDSLFTAISETLAAYRKAADDLLRSKYANVKQIAPLHLRKPCSVLIIRCEDGMFVRYDLASDGNAKIRCAQLKKTLAEISPQFSDQMIHFPQDPNSYVP